MEMLSAIGPNNEPIGSAGGESLYGGFNPN